MKRALLLALLALGGCGGSGPSAHAKLVKNCRSENLTWAKNYVASLPGPVTPGTIAALAQPLIDVCIATGGKS